jgi:hypothetical protein
MCDDITNIALPAIFLPVIIYLLISKVVPAPPSPAYKVNIDQSKKDKDHKPKNIKKGMII